MAAEHEVYLLHFGESKNMQYHDKRSTKPFQP